MSPDVYCSTPYTLVMIQPDGSFRMCCLSNDSEYDMGGCRDSNTGEVMNIFTHDLIDALNSTHHLALRRAHESGIKHKMCSVCYNRDAINGSSRRNYVSVQLPQKYGTAPLQKDIHKVLLGNEVVEGPYALDLRFGNICNLKCVTCGPWYSDKWIEEYRGFYGRDAYTFGGNHVTPASDGKVFNIKSAEQQVPWWESDVWWTKLDAVLPNLTHLYITGGEPMLVPAHDKLLQRCIDAGVAHQITIEIDTNLTALNLKIMDLWSEFKHIDLRVSIDTIGSKYEVFRFPSKWKKFNTNLSNLVAYGLGNVSTILTTCVTPFNLFDIDLIHDYSDSMGLERKPHFRFVEKPEHLDIRFMSKEQKQMAISNLLLEQKSEWAAKIAEYLKGHYETYNKDHLLRFVKFADYLDTTRGTNWRHTFQSTAYMYEDHML